jgi:predicted Zn-dependent protease
MKYTPKEIQENVNVSQTSPLKELFLLLGGALGILLVIYIVLGFAVDLIVPRLPPGIEGALGELYTQRFAGEEQTAGDEYLQKLLNDLVKELPEDPIGYYYVHLISSSQPNALALPGGHIIVLSALVEELDSENELAFILAHELGHFANRDHLRGLGRGLVMMAISAVLFGVDNELTGFLMNSLMNVEMKFSQRQETKADLFALELLNRRYGHIAGATDFFRKAAEKETRSRLAYYFATHPYPEDRVATLQQQIQKKGYAVGERRPLDERLKTVSSIQESEDVSLREILNR